MHMYRLLFCCVLVFIQVQFRCHAQTAYLESYRVLEGDIALLIIEYDSKIPSLYAIDTSPLEDNFEVLDIKSRVSQIMEPNNAFNRMQWKIEILPRHDGSLRIPALRVGAISTPELTLEVQPQTPELRTNQNVFVEVQAQPQNPYVGQLTHVIVRVLHNIPLSDSRLLDPSIENARVYRLGKDSRTVTFLGDQEFNVLERRFALIAQAPGDTQLSSASYRGLIKSAPESADTEAPAHPRRINRTSKALQLQVRKPPSTFSGKHWLPAIQLEVSERWEDIPAVLNVGDSLGFTVTIESRGLPAEALPAGLLSADSDQFKIYADQEIRSNRLSDNSLVGTLEQRFAVVVSKPGEIELPPTRLKWWDITGDIERVALLEGKILIVVDPAQALAGNNETSQTQLNLTPVPIFGLAWMRMHWLWLVATGLILFICLALLRHGPVRDRFYTKLKNTSIALKNRKNLRQACIANDAARARRALLEWGRGQWPDDNINGLNQIEIRTKSSTLLRELSRLDAALYADQATAWQGRSLWQSIVAEGNYPPAGTDAGEKALPDLYPQQNQIIQTLT